ncbi:MAG: aminopeptidase [Candidatus Heimdallarchaeota archaeon]|nr:MAG: aminopeptidase [Candidatus Heimdallarchaeota archaeon]
MYADYNEKLAKLIVQYATNVQPDDLVLIQGSINSEPLIKEVYSETLHAGGHIMMVRFKFEGQDEMFYTIASDQQLQHVHPLEIEIVKTINVMMSIHSEYNTRSLTNISAEKRLLAKEARKEISNIFLQRAANKDLRWNIAPYPCNAHAQEANMGQMEYQEFVYRALNLHQDDPVEYWRKIEKDQKKIVEILDKGSVFQILGEDTNLTLAIENRKWINSCGHENLPDGEVYTGPHEEGVNGTIRFTFPGIYQGQEIEDIRLTFKDGRVINHEAVKGEELLEKILTIPNANILGELAVGTNYNINKFTKNMLFDEKMGGTIHLALGSGYPESGSKNQSAIHWDILKDMNDSNAKILLDDEVIYQAGKWVNPKENY